MNPLQKEDSDVVNDKHESDVEGESDIGIDTSTTPNCNLQRAGNAADACPFNCVVQGFVQLLLRYKLMLILMLSVNLVHVWSLK
mmetsp:Transcript_15760/g.19215  ORF Transcript_15760/g.19215 Transcript_15760/m.19215 type:complete len:84 (-) Transcript_15760:17-268(-)